MTDIQGLPKECFPGCKNALGKLRQKWKTTAVTKKHQTCEALIWQPLYSSRRIDARLFRYGYSTKTWSTVFYSLRSCLHVLWIAWHSSTRPKQYLPLLMFLHFLQAHSLSLYHCGHEEDGRWGEDDPRDTPGHGIQPPVIGIWCLFN